jgi:DNA-binding transcriptional ArsR family regulator
MIRVPLAIAAAIWKNRFHMATGSGRVVLRAIAEPRRRAILRLVLDQERSAGAIASEFEVTREAISQHLRVLKQAGLIAERKEGTRRFYRARPEGLAEVRPFLEEMWDDSLALLKAAVERKRTSQRRGR